MFTESDPLYAAAQREKEIVSSIQTAHATEMYAQQQRKRRQLRPARLEIKDMDLEIMIKDFTVAHGGIVRCPPAYTVPSSRYRNQRLVCSG